MPENARQLLCDLEVGNACNLPLIVKTVTAKETRGGKPYLFFELYDGQESIVGNYWDWNGNAMPPKNAILNVVAKVDSWQGKKQLNIKALTTNTELAIEDFMPASEYDLPELYKEAYAILSDVKNDTLRSIALGLLEDLHPQWLTAPGASNVHHAYVGGTLVHSLSVMKIAKAIAEVTPGASVDLCVVGGFLHDIGKFWSYEYNGISIEMTNQGKLFDHTFLGSQYVSNWTMMNVSAHSEHDSGIAEILIHLILSHHGRPEYGAPVPPLCIEAHIVAAADNLDATNEQIREISKNAQDIWTDKIWTLNNRPHLSVGYVQQTTAPGISE